MVREISHFLMVVKLKFTPQIVVGRFPIPGRPLSQHVSHYRLFFKAGLGTFKPGLLLVCQLSQAARTVIIVNYENFI